ncbi:hypothetical protein LDENG_00134240 [Lucifuga dentata]|nr:hypothetical protein LDENG_00134240 [Lucifuga dentata]
MSPSLPVSDYELQVSLSEALCRLTPRKDRQQRANQWFSGCDIIRAFCHIRDRDFEVLFCPKDEKLDEFWIDFNVSSECVSFFVDEPQLPLFHECFHYGPVETSVFPECTEAEAVILSVHLINPIMHHNTSSQTVQLTFSSQHHRQVEEAAERVFKKPVSSTRAVDGGGTVLPSPSAGKPKAHSYTRKKAPAKSLLKILPLSSPSSGEDCSATKIPGTSRGEFLFDHIRTSTPKQTDTYDSGFPVELDLEITEEVSRTDRKRPPPESSLPVYLHYGRWQKVEAEVHLSVKECQQQISSLLRAVHHHRLLLLEKFENNAVELEENLTNLNIINTEILFEVQRLTSFCDEQQQRMRSLACGRMEEQVHPPSQ